MLDNVFVEGEYSLSALLMYVSVLVFFSKLYFVNKKYCLKLMNMWTVTTRCLS